MAVNLFVMTIAPERKEFNRLQTFTQIVSVVTEQIQSRVVNNVDYELLCRERDNFRITVAITNAVLSRTDMDELVSEVAKEIHYYFDIDDISIVLRSHRKNKLNIYSTHYLDKQHPAHEQSEVDEAGTLTERVFKSKEMLLINLHERDDLAPYERMLFNTGQSDSNLVPVTADVWRHHAGRTETGAMRRESLYHYQSEFTAPDCRTCGNRCR